MKYHFLAIDFGESHIGLSVSNGLLPRPLPVFNYPHCNYQILRLHLINLITKVNPSTIVIGVPNNQTSEEKIKKIFSVIVFPEDKFRKMIVWFNEDYSTQQAILLKKRKRMREDSIAASIILENYLINQNK